MRSNTSTVSLAAADPDGVCLSQTPAATGVQELTIAGALASGGVATMDTPRHVSITSAANDSGRTFTVTGTDRYGNTISEAITGPNTTTVVGSSNFATVTSVQTDDDTLGAITVGSADEAEGPWIPLNHQAPAEFNVALHGRISSGASLTYGVELTMENVQQAGFKPDDPTDVVAHATVTGKSAAFQGSQKYPVRAMRLAVSGHSSGSAYLDYMETSW